MEAGSSIAGALSRRLSVVLNRSRLRAALRWGERGSRQADEDGLDRDEKVSRSDDSVDPKVDSQVSWLASRKTERRLWRLSALAQSSIVEKQDQGRRFQLWVVGPLPPRQVARPAAAEVQRSRYPPETSSLPCAPAAVQVDPKSLASLF